MTQSDATATMASETKRSFAERFLLKLLSPKVALPLLALLMLLATPLVMRAYHLQGIPNKAEPFDLEQAGEIVVPAGKNAFDLYRVAATTLRSAPQSAEFVDQLELALEGTWSDTAPEVRVWLQNNETALETFVQGSEREESLYYQPAEYNISTLLPVSQMLRDFARLSKLEAARRESEMDWSGSWKYQRAMLRASRHSGRYGCFIERLVGIAIYTVASEAVVRWAAHPEVSRDQLQLALADVQTVRKMTGSPSETLRTEYFVILDTLKEVAESEEGRRNQGLSVLPGVPEEALMGGGRFLMFAKGEAQISFRVARLVWTNYLSQVDKPRFQRPKRGFAGLYVLPASTSNPKNLYSETELRPWFQRTSFLQQRIPAVTQVETANDRDIARQDMLELVLALRIYAKDHAGAYPADLKELAPKYLPQIPADPFGKGEPLRYRRETAPAPGFILWSIGPDEVDDGAKIEFSGGKGDIVTRFPQPRPSKSGTPNLGSN